MIKKTRPETPTLQGILTTIPYEAVRETASAFAVRQDLNAMRQSLEVRCANTLLVHSLETVTGFNALLRRFGEQLCREFRFGKGCEALHSPAPERLSAIAANSSGAFEDWIYRMFQEERSLKRRSNAQLFQLLCRIRGRFTFDLASLLTEGFACRSESGVSDTDCGFLFAGCYFAGTGDSRDEQAFVQGLFKKIISQREMQIHQTALVSQNQPSEKIAKVLTVAALLCLTASLAWLGFVLTG